MHYFGYNGQKLSGLNTYGDTGSASQITSIDFTNCEFSSIADRAFYGCSALVSISIPKLSGKIGNYAFYGCAALNTVNIAEGTTEIGIQSFRSCAALETLILPQTLTVIGNAAFSGCTKLGQVIIPESVISIEASAFSNMGAKVDGGSTVIFNGKPDSIADIAFVSKNISHIYVPWNEGEVENAPWGATAATIHYNHLSE